MSELHILRGCDVKAIRNYLSKHPENVNKIIAEDTPLNFAIYRGRCDVFDTLLEYGANINLGNNYGVTPLHILCLSPLHSKMYFLSKLIGLGANGLTQDNNGKIPLHWAASHCDANIVNRLIPISNPNIIDINGETPFMRACIYNESEDVLFSLMDVSYNVNLQNNVGNTALHLAYIRYVGINDIAVSILKSHQCINLSIRNDKGRLYNEPDEDDQYSLY